jgi:hypothetical protein
MSTHVSTAVWFTGSDHLPQGEINPGGASGPFPMIELAPGARMQGFKGDYVPYLRRLAAVATALADEIEATP